MKKSVIELTGILLILVITLQMLLIPSICEGNPVIRSNDEDDQHQPTSSYFMDSGYIIVPEDCDYIGTSNASDYIPGTFEPIRELTDVKGYIVDKNNQYFSNYNGVLFTKDFSTLLRYPMKKLGMQYRIPLGVKTINDSAFENCYLYRVVCSDSVQYIGEDAFYNTKLRSVVLPDGLLEIGRYAFKNNYLSSIVLPNSLEVIGVGAFEANMLSQISLPYNLKSIGSWAFYGNPLSKTSVVELPATLEHIGDQIFGSGTSSWDTWTPIYLVYRNSIGMEWAKNEENPYIIVD